MSVIVKIIGKNVSGAAFRDASGDLEKLKQKSDDLGQTAIRNEGRFKRLSDSVRSFSLVYAGAIGGAVLVGKKLIDSASDLNEAINASKVVFGQASDKITEFAKIAATQTGLAEDDFNQLAATTGSFLMNYGLSSDEAADKTIRLAERAADMASVFNTDVKDALNAINAALRGETEPIRRYAADVTDATLEQVALSEGITKSVSEMTQQEKGLLRLQAVFEQTDRVQGDFVSTSNDYANASRILDSNLTNLSATLGEKLLPQMADTVVQLNELVTLLNKVDWDAVAKGVNAFGIALEKSNPALFLINKIFGELREGARESEHQFQMTAENIALMTGNLSYFNKEGEKTVKIQEKLVDSKISEGLVQQQENWIETTELLGKFSEQGQITTDEQIANIEKLDAEMERQLDSQLKKSQDTWNRQQEMHRQFVGNLQANLENVFYAGFSKIMDKTLGKANSVFEQIVAAFASAVFQMVAQAAAAQLIKILFGGFFDRGGLLGFQRGGIVPKVQYAATGMIARGTDTVPFMGTPGEAVIDRQTVRQNQPIVQQLISGQRPEVSEPVIIQFAPNFNVNTIDKSGVDEFLRSSDFRRSFITAVEDGLIRLKAGSQKVSGAQ